MRSLRVRATVAAYKTTELEWPAPAAECQAPPRPKVRENTSSFARSFLSKRGRHDRWRVRLCGQRCRNRPGAHDADAIAHAQNFRQIAGNHQHRQTAFRKRTNNFVDLTFCADIHTLCRLV